jgi:hypothetical protein
MNDVHSWYWRLEPKVLPKTSYHEPISIAITVCNEEHEHRLSKQRSDGMIQK